MSIIVPRPRIQDYLARGGRRLLYGRRKTGKTFAARHALPDHKYYIVRRNRMFYQPQEGHEAGLREVLLECRSGQPLIIDEFHRADPRLYDALQAGECPEIVLITSTLHLFRRLVQGRDAPLAGLFQGLQVPLIHPVELLATPEVQRLVTGDPKRGVEALVYWQEPVWVGSEPAGVVQGAYTFTLSLTSEILAEEEATYSQRLLAILSAVAAGKTRLAEIASYLYAQGPRPVHRPHSQIRLRGRQDRPPREGPHLRGQEERHLQARLPRHPPSPLPPREILLLRRPLRPRHRAKASREHPY